MSTIADRLYAQATIRPIKPENRIKSVTKQPSSDLRVEFNSGKVALIRADDELFQAFVVYTVLVSA